MKNLAFHSLLRRKMIILPILTTSLIRFLFIRLRECTFMPNHRGFETMLPCKLGTVLVRRMLESDRHPGEKHERPTVILTSFHVFQVGRCHSDGLAPTPEPAIRERGWRFPRWRRWLAAVLSGGKLAFHVPAPSSLLPINQISAHSSLHRYCS